MKNVKKVKNYGKYAIIVVRLGGSGDLRNSKPCTNCYNTLLKYRIKKVIYVDENNNIVEEKTRNLEGKTTFSKGYISMMRSKNKKK